MRRLLALPVLLLAALAGCALSPETTVPLTTVEAATFEIRIEGHGELKAAKATKIEVPNTLRGRQQLIWLLDEGSPVEEGELVARLDETQMRRRERRTEEAILRLSFQLKAKESVLEKERRGVENTLEQLGRERADAQHFAPQDTELFSRHEILDAQWDMELLDTRIEHAKARIVRNTKRAEAEMDILRLQNKTEELRLSQLRQALGKLEIRAPHSGVFFPHTDWRGEKVREGATAWGGHPLGELPDLGAMEAKIHILESEAAGLEEGLSVRIALDAHPDLSFEGTVSSVQPVANSIERRSPVKYFEVKIALEHTDQAVMKPASQVRATIYVLREDGVFSVPNQAVFHDSDGTWVYVAQGSDFERKDVSLGKRSLSRTVIVEGLEAGDRIALTDPTEDKAETS